MFGRNCRRSYKVYLGGKDVNQNGSSFFKEKKSGKDGEHITYPAPYTKMLEESTTRRPQDLRHEAVVQVKKVGSENALDGANGVKASGLD